MKSAAAENFLALPTNDSIIFSQRTSAKFNGILSFHAFPTHSDLRRQWLVNIRRDHFTITSHTRVCCRHFASDQLIETERRPELVPPDDQEEHSLTRDHDYCSVPEPSALDISASAAEDLSEDVETLRKEIQELRVQREFGLQRFAALASDVTHLPKPRGSHSGPAELMPLRRRALLTCSFLYFVSHFQSYRQAFQMQKLFF
uniref:THAP domain-containing protein 1 n=1 Tax=Maylandia zebra TaxID=106582 RepID=A0A3P9BW33_9CICH